MKDNKVKTKLLEKQLAKLEAQWAQLDHARAQLKKELHVIQELKRKAQRFVLPAGAMKQVRHVHGRKHRRKKSAVLQRSFYFFSRVARKRDGIYFRKNVWAGFSWAWWLAVVFVMGKGMKESFEGIGKRLDARVLPSAEQVTMAGYHVLSRFVRVTLFMWAGFILGGAFVLVEVWILLNQNALLREQNKLVNQQNALNEASRRSSLVLLMSNVEDRIAEELRDTVANKKRALSDALVGRIIALCNSMKPYRYLEGDSLSQELSPERGQMLISLVNAGLDTLTYDKIFEKADFEYADLGRADLEGKYLKKVNLGRANLSWAYLIEANLEKANLEKANLSQANLGKANLEKANLEKANLGRADLGRANLGKANLMEANLGKAYLGGADLGRACLSQAYLGRADLSQADLWEADLSQAILDSVKITLGAFNEIKYFPTDKYEIDSTPQEDVFGNFYYVRRKE